MRAELSDVRCLVDQSSIPDGWYDGRWYGNYIAFTVPTIGEFEARCDLGMSVRVQCKVQVAAGQFIVHL